MLKSVTLEAIRVPFKQKAEFSPLTKNPFNKFHHLHLKRSNTIMKKFFSLVIFFLINFIGTLAAQEGLPLVPIVDFEPPFEHKKFVLKDSIVLRVKCESSDEKRMLDFSVHSGKKKIYERKFYSQELVFLEPGTLLLTDLDKMTSGHLFIYDHPYIVIVFQKDGASRTKTLALIFKVNEKSVELVFSDDMPPLCAYSRKQNTLYGIKGSWTYNSDEGLDVDVKKITLNKNKTTVDEESCFLPAKFCGELQYVFHLCNHPPAEHAKFFKDLINTGCSIFK